jgi:malate synthase
MTTKSVKPAAGPAEVREDVRGQFPGLFGSKTVNGRKVNVEQTIAALTRELRPEIAAALDARRTLLCRPTAPVQKRYGWPSWERVVCGSCQREVAGPTVRSSRASWTTFSGRDSEWRWRLNDETPIPQDAHPLKNPGLELTGPWHPLDMVFNALNSPAPMNMPDFEDASPPHFQPDGTPTNRPIGTFAAIQNAGEIFRRPLVGPPVRGDEERTSKRTYRIDKAPSQWPTRFVAASQHPYARTIHVQVDGHAGARTDRHRGPLDLPIPTTR